MTDDLHSKGLTRDQVYLVGLARTNSTASLFGDFGPSLEIYAVPQNQAMASHIRRATAPNFVFDPLANPFIENAVDYFIDKNEKPVLTPSMQTWLYAGWKNSGNEIKQEWIREAMTYQEIKESLRAHLFPKRIEYGLNIHENESDKEKKTSHDLCHDPESPLFLNTFCLSYTHLPSNYAVREFTVYFMQGNIYWMEFSKPAHPLGFYKIEVEEGELAFKRSEKPNGPGTGRKYIDGEHDIPDYEVSPEMSKVNHYLDNIPALCDYLNVPDFSSYLSLKPKITADLSAHIHLDALIFDKNVSKKQRAFFKEKFSPR